MALNTTQAAEKLGTDPKTFRRFLRSEGLGVGKGSRYSLEAKDVTALKKKFNSWSEADKNKKAETAKVSRTRTTKVVTNATPHVDEDPTHEIKEQNTTGRATS